MFFNSRKFPIFRKIDVFSIPENSRFLGESMFFENRKFPIFRRIEFFPAKLTIFLENSRHAYLILFFLTDGWPKENCLVYLLVKSLLLSKLTQFIWIWIHVVWNMDSGNLVYKNFNIWERTKNWKLQTNRFLTN